jgi:tyrosinase
MATYTRKNAFNNNGTFDNPDLHWYAIGVRAMQARALDDSASWWFFAAIHGEYVSKENTLPVFPGWAHIPGPPAVPSSPLPSVSVIDRYWNQCQHQSWYFLPWHRGYLLALEAQLRADITAAGGPADWALPYWNYFGDGSEFNIPPAFTQTTLPDGSANPLFVGNRFGPYANGVIFVPTPAGIKAHPGGQLRGPVLDGCLDNTVYTGMNLNTPPPGFGGPVTGFSHDGSTSGNLESNPHNLVHVYVGGTISNTNYGLMADPGTAGLDPIFYLHHANIDRMWAVWNMEGNVNPTDASWLNGPAASGDNEFVMPMPQGGSWIYTPRDVTSLNQLDYTYSDLSRTVKPKNLLSFRLKNLGVAAATAEKVAPESGKGGNVELVGANTEALSLTGTSLNTSVKLDNVVRNKVSASLLRATETAAAPDRMYLKLENIRGTHDASVLNVYVNVPANESPGAHPELLAGTIGLFGLRRSSMQDGRHGGAGLSFVLDISDIVDRLHLSQQLTADALRVTVVPNQPVPADAAITVGRISLYRHGS